MALYYTKQLRCMPLKFKLFHTKPSCWLPCPFLFHPRPIPTSPSPPSNHSLECTTFCWVPCPYIFHPRLIPPPVLSNAFDMLTHVWRPLPELEIFDDVEKENLAHLLASMHLALRQQDGADCDEAGSFGHITNTSFEMFVRRSASHLSHQTWHVIRDQL